MMVDIWLSVSGIVHCNILHGLVDYESTLCLRILFASLYDFVAHKGASSVKTLSRIVSGVA